MSEERELSPNKTFLNRIYNRLSKPETAQSEMGKSSTVSVTRKKILDRAMNRKQQTGELKTEEEEIKEPPKLQKSGSASSLGGSPALKLRQIPRPSALPQRSPSIPKAANMKSAPKIRSVSNTRPSSYNQSPVRQIPRPDPDEKPDVFTDIISQISIRKLNDLKNRKMPPDALKEVFLCLLVLFSEVDTSIELDNNNRILPSRVWEYTQKYLSRPGNVIQTLRRFSEWAGNQSISANCVRRVFERLGRLQEEAVLQADPTGVAGVLYKFLQTAVKYYDDIHNILADLPLDKGPVKLRIEGDVDNPKRPVTAPYKAPVANEQMSFEFPHSDHEEPFQSSVDEIPFRTMRESETIDIVKELLESEKLTEGRILSNTGNESFKESISGLYKDKSHDIGNSIDSKEARTTEDSMNYIRIKDKHRKILEDLRSLKNSVESEITRLENVDKLIENFEQSSMSDQKLQDFKKFLGCKVEYLWTDKKQNPKKILEICVEQKVNWISEYSGMEGDEKLYEGLSDYYWDDVEFSSEIENIIGRMQEEEIIVQRSNELHNTHKLILQEKEKLQNLLNKLKNQ